MMTRKYYQLIAAAVAEAHEDTTTHAPLLDVAQRLADKLAQDNPRFDRERFLEACNSTYCNRRS